MSNVNKMVGYIWILFVLSQIGASPVPTHYYCMQGECRVINGDGYAKYVYNKIQDNPLVVIGSPVLTGPTYTCTWYSRLSSTELTLKCIPNDGSRVYYCLGNDKFAVCS